MKTSEVFFWVLTATAGGLIVNEVTRFKREEFVEKIPTALGAYNNPGNIKKPNGFRDMFRGEIVVIDGSPLSSFSSVVLGARAVARIVKTKYSNGFRTPSQIVRNYDPAASEETLKNYEKTVAQFAGIGINDDIGTSQAVRAKVVEGIIAFEQGHDWNVQYAAEIPSWAQEGVSLA